MCVSQPRFRGAIAVRFLSEATALCAAVALAGAATVSAQDYPAKPVRIITGASGGGSDFTARQIGQVITGSLGQPVIVDNRATTILAADGGVKSPPDGYSIFMVGSS